MKITIQDICYISTYGKIIESQLKYLLNTIIKKNLYSEINWHINFQQRNKYFLKLSKKNKKNYKFLIKSFELDTKNRSIESMHFTPLIHLVKIIDWVGLSSNKRDFNFIKNNIWILLKITSIRNFIEHPTSNIFINQERFNTKNNIESQELEIATYQNLIDTMKNIANNLIVMNNKNLTDFKFSVLI